MAAQETMSLVDWVMTTTISDWLMIAATALSPLIAVQVTQLLDRRRAHKDYQHKVFETLMATRATPLHPLHVESLNRIDLAFYRQKNIRNAWKEYLDHLDAKNTAGDAWHQKRIDLLVNMLAAMAGHLGFADFDKTHLKNAGYYPIGHGDVEKDQETIRRSLADILAAKRPFPIWVANLRDDPPPQPAKTIEEPPQHAA